MPTGLLGVACSYRGDCKETGPAQEVQVGAKDQRLQGRVMAGWKVRGGSNGGLASYGSKQ